jgi:hypothetical protein
MPCKLEIETIVAALEQLLELYSQQTTLCKHSAMLFYRVTETAVHLLAFEYNSLAEQGTDLGTAYIKDIAQTREVGQCNITPFGAKAISQSCTVDEKIQSMAVAEIRYCSKLGLAVYESVLGRA